MPPLAHAALAASIVLSALGAIVICVLTVLYGFTPPGDEPPGQAHRRALLIRIGHAAAAACFAGTAIMLAVVLAQVSAAVAPTADPRVPALAAKLDMHVTRLQGMEQRMKDSEQTLERVETQLTEVSTRRMPEPSAAPAVLRPRSAAPAAPTPIAAKPAERRVVVVTPPRAAVRPASVPVPSTPVATVPPAPPASAVPPAVTAPSADSGAVLKDVPDQPPAAPAPVTAPMTAARAPAPAPRSLELAPPRKDFSAKLRDDWSAIRRGWQNAGDDLKRAIAPLRGE
jgi:hypothetical protein